MQKIKTYFTKQVLTAIVALGAIVILCLYVFVYMDYDQKTLDLETSNRQLRSSVNTLKTYHDNLPTYEEDIEAMEKLIAEGLEEYPADVRPEDVVMLAVDIQENAVINYTNINMTENALVYAVPKDIVVAGQVEGLTEEIRFNEFVATYANITDYANLKECVERIYAADQRIGIQNIAYTKEEEIDVLKGIIDLVFYSAAGTGKEYVAPDIAEYQSGTENFFMGDPTTSVLLNNNDESEDEEE